MSWHSPYGQVWRPVSGPFDDAIVDGVEAFEGMYMVFGHDPGSGELFIWSSEDTTNWSEAVVSSGLSPGSEIRDVTSSRAGLIAVGIEAETFNTLVWTATEGNDWRQTAVIPPR